MTHRLLIKNIKLNKKIAIKNKNANFNDANASSETLNPKS